VGYGLERLPGFLNSSCAIQEFWKSSLRKE